MWLFEECSMPSRHAEETVFVLWCFRDNYRVWGHSIPFQQTFGRNVPEIHETWYT